MWSVSSKTTTLVSQNDQVSAYSSLPIRGAAARKSHAPAIKIMSSLRTVLSMVLEANINRGPDVDPSWMYYYICTHRRGL